jgi:chromosome partitioning protein
MSAPIIAFFNNKGGVGKTSLVYHLAWMFSDLGVNVLAADLDPQANLTAAFLEENLLETLWEDQWPTVYSSVEPLIQRTGQVRDAKLWPLTDELTATLHLLVGDLRLSGFEDLLATGWNEARGGQASGFVVSAAFWRILTRAGAACGADVVLLDLGPNLGAINRSALLAADHLIVPLAADLFSLQGMKNLGPTVHRWQKEWKRICELGPALNDSPAGAIRPLGYVVQQHSVRLDRAVKSYDKWMARIPGEFRRSVLGEEPEASVAVRDDPWCLALLKHYHSLMPMAQEARKPMFHLKVADGAIGAHFQAAQSAGQDFKRLAQRIAEGAGVPIPRLTGAVTR